MSWIEPASNRKVKVDFPHDDQTTAYTVQLFRSVLRETAAIHSVVFDWCI